MEANIDSIVRDMKKVSVEQVIFEAVTNSIQAKATHINIYFDDLNHAVDDEDNQFIFKIKIIDNGEGFTPENLASFKTYRSVHKKNMGAKGIGRFLYLKLFNQIDINSLSNNIKFTIKNDVEIKEAESFYKETVLSLSSPRENYQICKSKFEQNLKNHFLPYFKLLKNDNKIIKITIIFNEADERIINSSDVPNFNIDSFILRNNTFNLSYIINDKNISTYEGFYCASNRVVLKNSQLDNKVKFKSFHGVNILFLLSSEYFDNHVNDERDEFTIKALQTNQDLHNDISWTDIQDALSRKIKEVCLLQGIDIEKKAQINLQKSIETAPFLAQYLDKNESVLSSDELIKKAKKAYEEEKQFLRDTSNKLNNDYRIKLNRVVQSELAEYIFDREKIINKLRDMVDDELLEKEIHNLFMQQRTEDSSQNYRTNNLWLFDDRFMTYDKVFSETQIKTIFPELSDNINRLDLCIVSNTYEKEAITDIIVIELKRPTDTITPASAEEQLLKYARYINSTQQHTKIRVWTYALLKFNEDSEASLIDKDYNKIPTHNKYPIYYRYYERTNVIINFMDYKALADDAHTRNQTFINILKGKSL